RGRHFPWWRREPGAWAVSSLRRMRGVAHGTNGVSGQPGVRSTLLNDAATSRPETPGAHEGLAGERCGRHRAHLAREDLDAHHARVPPTREDVGEALELELAVTWQHAPLLCLVDWIVRDGGGRVVEVHVSDLGERDLLEVAPVVLAAEVVPRVDEHC